ncbi:AntA/AntB antirepressor [Gluconobacter japonicus]|nr:AntA/AntB antirepressor [Gluconobacter japonicus]
MSPNLPIPAEFKEIATICAATDVVIGGKVVLGIENARSLHGGLKVETRFDDWIRRRLNSLGMIENADYEVFLNSEENLSGGRPPKDYRLTLDAAKHIAMVEKNEVGRLVRSYFIWIENNARAVAQTVNVVSLEATVRQVLGGIVKGVVNKALAETVAPVLATLRTTHQTGTSAVTDRTAKEWLVQYGCVQTGRGRIVKRVGNALRALGMKQGVPLLRCARTNTWLFPHELAVPFMESQGKAWVRLHNDEVLLGQKPIKEFTRRNKEAPCPFAKKPEGVS